MTRRRFYAPPEAFAPDAKFVSLSAEETRHLRDVLRLKSGDEVYVFDGAGREVRGQVQSITRDATEVAEWNALLAAPPDELDVGLAMVRVDVFVSIG